MAASSLAASACCLRHAHSQHLSAFVKDIEIRLIRKDTIAAFARDLAHNAQAAKPLDGRAYRWEG